MSFLLRKVEDVTTISKPQSLTSVRIKDCTFRFQTKLLHYFCLSNNKSNLHFSRNTSPIRVYHLDDPNTSSCCLNMASSSVFSNMLPHGAPHVIFSITPTTRCFMSYYCAVLASRNPQLHRMLMMIPITVSLTTRICTVLANLTFLSLQSLKWPSFSFSRCRCASIFTVLNTFCRLSCTLFFSIWEMCSTWMRIIVPAVLGLHPGTHLTFEALFAKYSILQTRPPDCHIPMLKRTQSHWPQMSLSP